MNNEILKNKIENQYNDNFYNNFKISYDYDNDSIENLNSTLDEDSYIDLLEKLRIQCKQKILNYQEEHNLNTNYYHSFSNIIKNEDDFINHLNMNNPEEAELFFDNLQSLLNRNFIENRKYENFDDCCEIEYDNNALESAQICENDINNLKENYKKNYKLISKNKSSQDINIVNTEKKKKIIKKKTTTYFQKNDPPKDIIHKNYNKYIYELEEKRKNEENNFKFIAKPPPTDILKPKYDNIMEQAKIRQQENINSRLNMWKTTVKPFSFDSRDAEKQRKKMEEETLKEKEQEKVKNNHIRKKIIFRLVQTAAEDGYERYKKMKEIDNKAHLTPEHIFHPNISKDIPLFYKINSKKYKEMKEKKKIEQFNKEQKEIERRVKYEKLRLERFKTQPLVTYRDTRSSLLRNKAKNEKDESEKLYKDVEKEIREDKEKDQLKIKNYVQNKLKDLYFRKYTYEKEIKYKGAKALK
ncbi:hypothetical protein PIROE2DRAFT_5514, partial [Piromyces sp. E2]